MIGPVLNARRVHSGGHFLSDFSTRPHLSLSLLLLLGVYKGARTSIHVYKGARTFGTLPKLPIFFLTTALLPLPLHHWTPLPYLERSSGVLILLHILRSSQLPPHDLVCTAKEVGGRGWG